MGEPEHRFARPSLQRARFVAAAVVIAAVGLAALAFMVAGVDSVEVLATLLFAPVVIAAIVGGRKMGYAAAVVATIAYLGLRFGDMDDTGTGQVLVLVAARAACFGVVAYATPLLADRVPSLARPTVSKRHGAGRSAVQEWDQAAPVDEYPLEDSFAFSEPVPAGAPAGAPAPWDGPPPPEQPAPYESAPYGEQPAYGEQPGYGEQPAYGEQPGYAEQPAAYSEPQYGEAPGYSEAPAYGEQPGYGEDPYAPPADPAVQPTAWDAPAVEPIASPWAPPPEPAPYPGPPDVGPAPDEWAAPPEPASYPGPPDIGPAPGEWAPPLEPAAAYPGPPDVGPAPDDWAPSQEPDSWDSPAYMGGAAAPSVPTGWIDDATVPLGDETIPVGFTGELFLPRELREHPLVEYPNGNGGSTNGGTRRHLADPGPVPGPVPGAGPVPGPTGPGPGGPNPGPDPGAPAVSSPFAGEVGLSPPGGPPPQGYDTGRNRHVGDTGEHHRGVDPETRLWNAHFFRDRLTQARDESRRSGQPFSLVMVQVADEPFQPLPYRRQVALLRELGHQFVQARVLDHLVHLPDGAQHWFAVILPNTDSAGAHLVERRLRSAIGGYLRSRGLHIDEVQSASLTSPDDDEALASVWASLLGSTSV